MPQNSDPFDEFRMKKVISNLETGFRHNAKRKRKRLKELLEEDDGGDPDGVEVRVQEEMESFFVESANAAESVFAEIGQAGAVEPGEIQQRIDEVLRPVEEVSLARREPTPERTVPDPDPDTDTDVGEDDQTPGPDDIRDALARLGGATTDRPPSPDPSPDSGSLPDWLDATEERVGDPDGDAEVEADEDRRRRILGAFDTSFDRLRTLIRDGLSDAEREAEAEAEAESKSEHEARTEMEREDELQLDEPEPDEPPLTRWSEGDGFDDSSQPISMSEETEPEAVATATEDAVTPPDLETRVETLEREVARLSRILVLNGLTDSETP